MVNEDLQGGWFENREVYLADSWEQSVPNREKETEALGCWPGPQKGAHKKWPHIDISLPLFLPPFPSLQVNK